jgi:hypothetical protein
VVLLHLPHQQLHAGAQVELHLVGLALRLQGGQMNSSSSSSSSSSNNSIQQSIIVM